MKKIHIMLMIASLALTATTVVYTPSAPAAQFLSAFPDRMGPESWPTEAERAAAEQRLPILTDPRQLPVEVREAMGIEAGDRVSAGFGTAGHPFTTKRAAPRTKQLATVKQFPYSATGKLWIEGDSGGWTLCTASVIDMGLLVTAAHCVWDYGIGPDSPAKNVSFEPARNGNVKPFGIWNAVAWIVPTVYADGTDVCDPASVGVVCENDIAVVVLDTNDAGQYIKQVVGGEYGWKADGYGYASFKGDQSAQITQLGYPVSLDSGYKMIRTDSLGYWASPSNVVIGSDQAGGSSGGPWLINYGMNPQRDNSNPPPSENASNKIVAVTSWGYNDSGIEVQGASRFGKNTTFTAVPNIKALLNYACSDYPDNCD